MDKKTEVLIFFKYLLETVKEKIIFLDVDEYQDNFEELCEKYQDEIFDMTLEEVLPLENFNIYWKWLEGHFDSSERDNIIEKSSELKGSEFAQTFLEYIKVNGEF